MAHIIRTPRNAVTSRDGEVPTANSPLARDGRRGGCLGMSATARARSAALELDAPDRSLVRAALPRTGAGGSAACGFDSGRGVDAAGRLGREAARRRFLLMIRPAPGQVSGRPGATRLGTGADSENESPPH